ncbi:MULTISPECIES: hybrid sensor histidine kinase/response regulator [Lysinibacillus]|uniref:hybrid sensor histidine kinase/response regulator n=1 Tax=Lysinibacillus TaxID=400634 RepID=UPI000689D8EC|nr:MULTISPECIES: ATP-binding protein [Lysinibacillus]WCH48155.1 ATP-binding protein [Lysinibacillus sp. OF-1]
MAVLRKTTIRHLLIIIAIFIVLTSLRLLWLNYFLPSNHQPSAQGGIVDLNNQDLLNEEVLSLNGEWLYSPGQFVNPENKGSSQKTNIEDHTIQTLPTLKGGKTIHPYGTYQLKILLPNLADNSRYAIRIPAISTASSLYINGELVGQSGKVADNRQDHKGQAAPYTVYFTNTHSEINIMLHVSNFDTSKSPIINKRISFGTASAMTHHQLITGLSLSTIVVMLILFALFSILVFLFIYRKPIVLLFTFGFLLPLADELITFDRSLLDWLHLDYVWSYKLSSIIFLGASFFFVQFMRVLLVKYHSTKTFQWIVAFYVLDAVFIIILPMSWLVPTKMIFFVLYLVSFLYVVVLALREYLENQKRSSAFIALTAVGTTNGILWGLIKSIYVFDIPVYPFDYLFVMLGFSSYWFRRFHENSQQIQKLVAKLQKEDTLKDEFLTSNAQKLWSPMNRMITLGQSIYDNPKNRLVAEDHRNLKHLIDIGRSMSFTLNDILDYTRLKEGNLHLHTQSVNLQGAVYGVFDMLRFIIDGKQIHMVSSVPRNFPNVLADENRLIQILFNLLHNALKYTSEGSIEITAREEQHMAIIHIRDTGQGMDDFVKSLVFTPYEQGQEHDEGIGIGLLISKKLIELHGGTMHIQSVQNKGSDIYFTLPLADESKQSEHTSYMFQDNTQLPTIEQRLSTVSEKHFSILMIDDDPTNLTTMKSIFSKSEYKVTTVTSSEKALTLIQQASWDLVIVDAMLPYISGYAVIERIRKQYSLLELPILLLTIRKHPEDVYTGFAYGANDYVTKPINALELKVRSRALIDLKYSIQQHLHLESAWLQAQIQPHFLFNTLNTIASLSTIDTDRMIDLMHHFGEYLHASFDVRNLQRVVPLEHELELVHSYLYIKQQRFGELIHIEWDIDENIEIEIPPISLQTLVENAIRHGILKKTEGGTVCIRIKDYTTYIAISVIDDGVGISPSLLEELQANHETACSGIGIRNTDLRLKRIYGQRLQIQSTVNQGTNVTFHIPKK